jgi:hypothetical protein
VAVHTAGHATRLVPADQTLAQMAHRGIGTLEQPTRVDEHNLLSFLIGNQQIAILLTEG